ncbi:hypothetical protein GCM10010357_04450 [Streptomyces luteireticuli]|uniref:Uncharacterized protein n=1 Tax=Streptomyces luteireticuli TaxID=173858 RepID=A0ABP3I0J9_9ACTN
MDRPPDGRGGDGQGLEYEVHRAPSCADAGVRGLFRGIGAARNPGGRTAGADALSRAAESFRPGPVREGPVMLDVPVSGRAGAGPVLKSLVHQGRWEVAEINLAEFVPKRFGAWGFWGVRASR